MSKQIAVKLSGPPPAPRSLSPTSASAWQQCELKYALTYLYGWREPSTLPQLIGNVVHRAVELLYTAPAPERSRERASRLLDVATSEEFGKDTYAHLAGAAANNAVAMAGVGALDGLFELEDPRTLTVGPDGLEVWVSADLYGAPIRGRIDRLYDAQGAQIIADYKTGKVPSSRFMEKAFFGLWTYAAALAAADDQKRLADRIELLYLVGRERLSRPVLRTVALDHAKALARIWRQVQAVTSSTEVTASTSRLCDWCAFAQACPARVTAPLPEVGSEGHDEVLRSIGLERQTQRTIAAALERVDDSVPDGDR